MNLTYAKTKLATGVLIFIGLYVLGANTYNSMHLHGTIEIDEVLRSSFTSLTTIVSSLGWLAAHNVDKNGDKL